MTKILIMGCGDVGQQVALLEKQDGQHVMGVVRSERSKKRLQLKGIQPIIADLDKPISLKTLPTKDNLIYYFAPPPGSGVIDSRVGNFLSSLSTTGAPRRLVLISTTGVYGDCQGEWVTEEREPNPQVDRARRRFSAENQFAQWAKTHEVKLVILRVPGIYGPGRLPIARLKDATPVLAEDQSPFSNRIHIHDLCRICLAAGHKDSVEGVFNVSDGNPSTMTDYFFKVADRMQIPRPPEISRQQAQQQFSENLLAYLSESKRLDNQRMLRELEIQLRYPDLESGLRTCHPETCGF